MQGYSGKHTSAVGEGNIAVWTWNYESITQGTWVWAAYANEVYYTDFYNTSGAQNDRINYNVYTDTGTYTICFHGYRGTSNAICTVLVDGNSVGTVDMYGAAANDFLWFLTGVAFTAGIHSISFKAATKNGSSAGYYIQCNDFTLFRTA